MLYMRCFVALPTLLISALACSQTQSVHRKVNGQPGLTGDKPAIVAPPAALVLPAVNNIAANWANAGLASVGGYPTRSKVCSTVFPSGVIPPAPGDDNFRINAAINACPAGQVVKLAASTRSSAVVSAAVGSNSLTLVSGSLVIGDMIVGEGILPGTSVTAGSGGSWTITMPVYRPLNSATVTVLLPFNMARSEYNLVNKGVTIRGSDTCTTYTSTPYCGTVINVYDGAIADWSISASQMGGNCGVVYTSATGSCRAPAGVFYLAPAAVYVRGWGGCGWGTTPTNCGTTLAADVAQGATTVQVASNSNFKVGAWVLIDENPQVVATASPTDSSKTVQASSDWLNASPSPATMRLEGGDEPSFYSFNPNRVNEELHRITAVGRGPCPGINCTLTFDDPLTLSFRQSGSHDARVYWPTTTGPTYTPFLTYAGVENLTILRPADGGVQMVYCAYCWEKGVEVVGWHAGGGQAIYSARDQFDSNFIHLGYDLENNGGEYPIAIDSASTEVLITNNIFMFGGKCMVGRAAPAAVVSYNYCDDTLYQNQKNSIGDYWMDMGVNGSHYAGAHHWLFEGNFGDNCDADNTHGDAIYHTFFRNECTGIRTTFVDPTTVFPAYYPSGPLTVDDGAGKGWIPSPPGKANSPAFLRAAGPMAYNYWMAFVGNVLGVSGKTVAANGWAYICGGTYATSGNTNKCIWGSGWTGGGQGTPDPHLYPYGRTSYIFRNGNYDYVTDSIKDWASGYSQLLPSSLYLSTSPAAFTAGASCTYPWPWVTASSATKLQTNSCRGSGLPALARWNAGTPFAQP